ncbi:hypothetical protein PDPUS_2_00206 [Photobacterium damselae subsp. piscicida]|uniref:Uncharacterized protein n=1 Tax=Photobacterium damsela subsp. piscicida TaxID=38294 RepID=A0AAD1CHV5_PHODP|nr:hypothetical protein PDPUS_2_00206 [Photobacterium damselae subsp. piscicida]
MKYSKSYAKEKGSDSDYLSLLNFMNELTIIEQIFALVLPLLFLPKSVQQHHHNLLAAASILALILNDDRHVRVSLLHLEHLQIP